MWRRHLDAGKRHSRCRRGRGRHGGRGELPCRRERRPLPPDPPRRVRPRLGQRLPRERRVRLRRREDARRGVRLPDGQAAGERNPGHGLPVRRGGVVEDLLGDVEQLRGRRLLHVEPRRRPDPAPRPLRRAGASPLLGRLPRRRAVPARLHAPRPRPSRLLPRRRLLRRRARHRLGVHAVRRARRLGVRREGVPEPRAVDHEHRPQQVGERGLRGRPRLRLHGDEGRDRPHPRQGALHPRALRGADRVRLRGPAASRRPRSTTAASTSARSSR